MTNGQHPITVIHVGPRMDGSGGTAAVMRSLRDAPDPARVRDVFVESITAGGPFATRLTQSATFPARFAGVLARHPDAILHAHLSKAGSVWRKQSALRMARLAGRPTVIHVHGDLDTWATQDPSRASSAAKMLERASAVVVLSESWRERVLALAPEARCVVIRNGVTVPDEPSTGSDPPHVLYLGTLSARKGVPELLEAVRGIQTSGPAATWTLAGDGAVEDTRAAVQTLPDPDAGEVPGWVGDTDKATLLARSDVFVLPSMDEGVPIALLEAMAYGLACVVTPVGGIPEVVRDGESGVFITQGDAASVEAGLRRVLEDEGLRRRLGETARETVRETCSMRVMRDELAILYASILEGSPTATGPLGQASSRRPSRR